MEYLFKKRVKTELVSLFQIDAALLNESNFSSKWK